MDFDVAVVGAGAVGLACARSLSQQHASVIVLEQFCRPGSGISSRNSEVIHAGFYYKTPSFKHRFCVRGRRMLYDYLTRAGIPFHKCGKLVIASNEQELEELERLLGRALENGVEGVGMVDGSTIIEMEPEIRSVGGLWSSETGIFDSHGYLLALTADIEANGGLIVYGAPLLGAVVTQGGFLLRIGGNEPTMIRVNKLINSAGLFATRVASCIEGLNGKFVPRQILAKGSYFGLVGRSPFKHLVYPLPTDGGLGVHATIDLSGRVRFGPDVEWLEEGTAAEDVSYAVDEKLIGNFSAAIRRYWPGLPDGALHPDYAGCRPKLSGPGEPAADFSIQTQIEHGVAGLINLFGIESPGLTSSLAIGEYVSQQLLI